MKKNILKSFLLALTLIFLIGTFTGCAGQTKKDNANDSPISGNNDAISDNSENTNTNSNSASGLSATELVVRFGSKGEPFTMHLYDNDTAAAIALYVGTADWQLPIYNYEGYDNWEVMQYYDIPSRYDIPSNPETITEAAAGVVYYSEPNRIVLFYGDAEVSSKYTPVGYFDDTKEFRSAVENNPVLEDWGNKLVLISDGK